MPEGLTLNQTLVLEILLGVHCRLGVKGWWEKTLVDATRV